MPISAESVRFDDDAMWGTLADGRVIGVPLVWYTRLLHASPDDRAAVEISPFGLHWEALDEDISFAGLLAGRGDQAVGPEAAGGAVERSLRDNLLHGNEAHLGLLV